MQKTKLKIRNVPSLLHAAGCTDLTTLSPGHNVNVPPMSATGERVSPKWLRGLLAPVYRGHPRVLLRKEVIQPHLPVRLPCYDLVLITDPTFDSSIPYGFGHWLRVLPTFMT